MRFARRLLRVQLRAQAALVACALAAAIVSGAVALITGENVIFVVSAYLVFTYLYGVIPAVVYGAPLYAIAATKHRATWRVVLAIGALPGVLLAMLSTHPSFRDSDVNPAMAAIVFACGVFVASLTHKLSRKSEVVVGAA